MLNIRQQANAKFDPNMYNFEKKRQNVDNKVKEKEKEREKINENINGKINNKIINKIQINFKNSFVNEQTHYKYDKIIENNIIRNIHKLDKIGEKNEESSKYKSNEDLNLDDNKNNFNLYNINETLNDNNDKTKIVNESEMILIESVSFLRNKLTEISKINDDQIPFTEIDEKNNLPNFKNETKPIIDETVRYESETELLDNLQEEVKKEEENKFEVNENLICEIEPRDKPSKEFYEVNVLKQIEDLEETYDKYLKKSIELKSVGENKNNEIKSILNNHMKIIISNIKERKRCKQSIKGERNKLLMEKLIIQSEEKIKTDVRKSCDIIAEQQPLDLYYHVDTNNPLNKLSNCNIQTFGKDFLLKTDHINDVNIEENDQAYVEDFVNINDEIKGDLDELDDKEVTLIHQSINMDNISKEEIQLNINLDEFIKENTNIEDDVTNFQNNNLEEDMTNFQNNNLEEDMTNFQNNNLEDDMTNFQNNNLEDELAYQEINPCNDNVNKRVLIFENYQYPEEYNQKIKKLEKIREKKIKDLEKIRQKSGCKNRKHMNDALDNTKSDISKNSIDKHDKNYKSKSKSPVDLKKKFNYISNPSENTRPQTCNISENSRTPIKIIREEAQAANQKIKATVNYTKLSNKKAIKSAISSICLAGEPNRSCREKILDIIEKCPCENFVILFKDNFGRFDLKAIFTYNPQSNRTELLTCLTNSPILIEPHMISKYYKYDLIQKDFKLLKQNREISVIVDGVTLISNK